jgi:hypothetical protein
MSLVTGRKLSRQQWDELPMPHGVVARVEQLADAEKRLAVGRNGLHFEWSPGVPIQDNHQPHVAPADPVIASPHDAADGEEEDNVPDGAPDGHDQNNVPAGVPNGHGHDHIPAPPNEPITEDDPDSSDESSSSNDDNESEDDEELQTSEQDEQGSDSSSEMSEIHDEQPLVRTCPTTTKRPKPATTFPMKSGRNSLTPADTA